MKRELAGTGRWILKGKRWAAFLLAACLLMGCGGGEEKKLQDLEFTVVPDREVPEELAKVIQDKKNKAFQLTYSTPEELYLVVGYGTQESGGYSIQVKDLYLTERSLILDTELLGPEETSAQGEEPSYPYLVLRTELRDEPVVFR